MFKIFSIVFARIVLTFHLQQLVRSYIAKSRIEIDQARMLVLNAASAVDKVGGKRARKEVWQHVCMYVCIPCAHVMLNLLSADSNLHTCKRSEIDIRD